MSIPPICSCDTRMLFVGVCHSKSVFQGRIIDRSALRYVEKKKRERRTMATEIIIFPLASNFSAQKIRTSRWPIQIEGFHYNAIKYHHDALFESLEEIVIVASFMQYAHRHLKYLIFNRSLLFINTICVITRAVSSRESSWENASPRSSVCYGVRAAEMSFCARRKLRPL